MKKQRDLLMDPAQFFVDWLSSKGWEWEQNGNIKNDGNLSADQIKMSGRLAYIDDVKTYNGSLRKNAKDKPLPLIDRLTWNELLLDRFLAEKADNFRDLKAHLKCEEETLEPIKAWVEILTGKAKEFDVLAMAHFLWQIKRKLNNKPVIDHLFPLISGKQGIGKSTAIQALLKPLAKNHLLSAKKLNEIGDERHWATFETKYVCFVSEMAGAKKAEIASLKSVVTNEFLEYRKLATHDTPEIKNNCTFIGDSNERLDALIKDTEMRRFYEIVAKDTPIDFNRLSEVDIVAIWRGIDEEKDLGYIAEVREAFRQVQNENATQHLIDDFLEQKDYFRPTDDSETVEYYASELYDKYKDWAISNNCNEYDLRYFGKYMKSLNWPSKRKSGGVIYYFEKTQVQRILHMNRA